MRQKLVSERLRGLYYMMKEDLSCDWFLVSPLTRRLIALGFISEMRAIIEELQVLNLKLDTELSAEDVDLDFDLWTDDTSDFQHIFQYLSYVEGKDDKSTINKIPDLFPLSKSPTFEESTAESLKAGMHQIGCDDGLNSADIAAALINGYKKIVCLMNEVKKKLIDIPDKLYEKYYHDFFYRDFDYLNQKAKSDYLLWKDEHEWKSIQNLDDKRTQEIRKLLECGVFKYSARPTNRAIKDCSIKIQEEALEYNTKHLENSEIECARIDKFVIINNGIMYFDHVKLGKYLYRHHKDLDNDQKYSLMLFEQTLNLIQQDMAVLNPKLSFYLPDYKDKQLKAVFDNAVKIITTCNPYLREELPNNFLELYLQEAFYGKIKEDVQKILRRKAIYTNICKLLGMLKASMRVFKKGTSSIHLASCLSPLTEKPTKNSMKREIDAGASDKNSKLRIWTDNYTKDHC